MDTKFKKELKARAHHLNPVILLGAKGLTDAVIAETDIALEAHELIKVSMKGADKDERRAMATKICTELAAEVVQHIGNIAVLYRKKIDK